MKTRKLMAHGVAFLSATLMAAEEPLPAEAGEGKPFTVTETEIKLPGVTIDRETREVRIDAKVCLDSGILEYVVCRPDTFDHEAIFTTEAKPELVHAALLLAGLKPTPMVRGLEDIWWDKALKQTDSRVKIEVEWQEKGGKKRANLTSMIQDREDEETETGAAAENRKSSEVQDAWVFAGSFMQPDRKSGERVYAANLSGILVGIWPDPSTVIQYGVTSGNPYEGKQGLEINEQRVPKIGTEVELIFSRSAPPAEKDSSKKPAPKDTSPGE